MKMSFLACVAFLSCGAAMAQSFSALSSRNGKNPYSDRLVDFYIRRTDVNAKYTEAYGGFTVNAFMRRDEYGKGDRHFHYENPTLGDMIFVLVRTIKGKNDNYTTEQAFGAGWLGWFQNYWNVVANDKVIMAAGVSYGDYIFGSQRADGSTLQPAGYYFHVGPAFMTSYLITDKLWVDGTLRYDIAAFRAGKMGTEIEGYQKPHFLVVGAMLRHSTSQLCGGFRVNTLIDRGVNKDGGVRVDLNLGFMF